jgi:hypothetical protein
MAWCRQYYDYDPSRPVGNRELIQIKLSLNVIRQKEEM